MQNFIEIFESHKYVKRKSGFLIYRSVVKIDLYWNSVTGHVSIDLIEITPSKRNKGYGSKFLELITNLADVYSVILKLEAMPLCHENYENNLERLCKLYEKFGFERRPVFNDKLSKHRIPMIRKPKGTK